VRCDDTRDAEDWPQPEVAVNIDTQTMGDLRLRDVDVGAMVAFMKALSDGYAPEPNDGAGGLGLSRLNPRWHFTVVGGVPINGKLACA
jgi:hypothetical protein